MAQTLSHLLSFKPGLRRVEVLIQAAYAFGPF
jgi:hypothetical protein